MALLSLLAAAAIAYPFLLVIYNIYFHPLRKFPGPFWNKISVLPKHYWGTRGELIYQVKAWHDEYGPVIRIAPGELAFKDGRAWKDIYGRRTAEGRYELPRDENFYNPLERPPSLLNSGRVEHDALRKVMSPAFSDKAIRSQEKHIGQYVDMLIDNLSTHCQTKPNTPVNMKDWMAFCTFDVIGNLAFGSDFDCLRTGTYHPWIKTVIATMREFAFMNFLVAIGAFPIFKFLIFHIGLGLGTFQVQEKLTKEKTKERLEMGSARDDFMDDLIKSGMSMAQLIENSSLLILAGSETSATLLTGAIYLLAMNPEAYKKWKDEVRRTFKDESEITLVSINKLDYMLAVLKESLRMYPPVAGSLPRMSPRGGTTIAGHFVPEGTSVGIWQWAVNYDESYFADAHKFDPDRCLHRANIIKNTEDGSEDPDTKTVTGEISAKYANDRLDVLNPFLVGPRNCLGQNLAYAEMRLILARIAFRFDIELCEDSRDWMDNQKNFVLWDKPDMFVKLTETVAAA